MNTQTGIDIPLPDAAVEREVSLTAMLERLAVAFACVSALVLGFAHLGKPSLWHDELVHVFVGKKILETGLPLLLSGRVFTNGTLFNYLLAVVMAAFGDGEAVVRSVSAVFFVINTFLTYRVMKPLVGGPAAAIAAVLFAWSPWSLAWGRQARFYMLHQTVYLLTTAAVWQFELAQTRRGASRWCAAICGYYLIGLLAGPQTVFFLGPIGAYAVCRWISVRELRSRWTALLLVVGILGTGTLLSYYLTLPKAEHDAIFKESLAVRTANEGLVDHDQSDSYYYFRFFTNNLSSGYFLLACIGFAWMAAREGRRGLFTMLAFVVPLLVLNYGIASNRRYRFLFFAYPFYSVACGYALVVLAGTLRNARRSALHATAALLILVFSARLALSTYRLAEDCVIVASGSDTTLAVHHPQWRQPCAYVREHLDGAVVVSTTYITTRYYVGQIDNWYPSRVIVWEYIESGMDGMKTLDEFKAYVQAHPKGFFLAEWRRFGMWPFFKEDLAWVEANLRRIDEASNSDITLYAWGM